MRVDKIVSFSVVVLLDTVLFAGVVPGAAQTDTMLFRYNADFFSGCRRQRGVQRGREGADNHVE